jgi:hypothetical protein
MQKVIEIERAWHNASFVFRLDCLTIHSSSLEIVDLAT